MTRARARADAMLRPMSKCLVRAVALCVVLLGCSSEPKSAPPPPLPPAPAASSAPAAPAPPVPAPPTPSTEVSGVAPSGVIDLNSPEAQAQRELAVARQEKDRAATEARKAAEEKRRAEALAAAQAKADAEAAAAKKASEAKPSAETKLAANEKKPLPPKPEPTPVKPTPAPSPEPAKDKATAKPLPATKVVVPSTDHVRVAVPKGLQAALDGDPRMQPWVKQVIAAADKCYANELKKNPLAAGVIEVRVTMHSEARPDAEPKKIPVVLTDVTMCVTIALTHMKMPLFTGKEGERHTVKVHFTK